MTKITTAALGRSEETEVTLLFANRSERDILWRAELERLQDEFSTRWETGGQCGGGDEMGSDEITFKCCSVNELPHLCTSAGQYCRYHQYHRWSMMQLSKYCPGTKYCLIYALCSIHFKHSAF